MLLQALIDQSRGKLVVWDLRDRKFKPDPWYESAEHAHERCSSSLADDPKTNILALNVATDARNISGCLANRSPHSTKCDTLAHLCCPNHT